MPAERRRLILEMLRERGSVTIDQVTTRFAVSSMTARRDLARLQEKGHVHRTHGGAVLPDVASSADPAQGRLGRVVTAKLRLATAVVATLQADETVFLDSSSSSYHVAWELVRSGLAVTVITNSVPVITLIGTDDSSHLELIGLGGSFRKPPGSFAGTHTVRTIESLFADRVIFSVMGIAPDGSLTDTNALEAAVKRAMITRARAVTLIAAAEKSNQSSLDVIVPASSVDTAYFADPPPAGAQRLKAAGVRIARI
jgi:DeoR/GlpR family transcriptional regulator of sugar metabolism